MCFLCVSILSLKFNILCLAFSTCVACKLEPNRLHTSSRYCNLQADQEFLAAALRLRISGHSIFTESCYARNFAPEWLIPDSRERAGSFFAKIPGSRFGTGLAPTNCIRRYGECSNKKGNSGKRWSYVFANDLSRPLRFSSGDSGVGHERCPTTRRRASGCRHCAPRLAARETSLLRREGCLPQEEKRADRI